MNKNVLWIVIGVVAAVAVVYLVATTDLSKVAQNNGGSEENAGQVGEVLVPGTSAVSDDGQVLAANGQTAKNDAEWGTGAAPRQSDPIDANSLPKDTIVINVTAGNFSPNNFRVNAGEAVVLSLTSKDNFSHGLSFVDSSLQAIAIGVLPSETRAITFNAPKQKGQYEFFDSTPGHRERGEVGTMIVE